tara:strand:+ start:748 stop:1005 length:258 start_codon:yes stop_codon:yes gene_type:complete
MLNQAISKINNLLDGTLGNVPGVKPMVKSVTPRTQSGGKNKRGGYKYSKGASLARSKRMTKRRKARTLKKKRKKRKNKGRGKKRS